MVLVINQWEFGDLLFIIRSLRLTTLSPLGWRPEGPFYDLSEIHPGTPSNDPFRPDALWNLNWQLKKTDVSLEYPDDGESITIHNF